jgi:ABC-type branched-subunit amino acid transport system ATPase component
MGLAGAGVLIIGISLPLEAYAPNPYVYMAVSWLTAVPVGGSFIALSPVIAAVTPYKIRSMGYALIGLYLSLFGGVGGALTVGLLAESLGRQLAIAIVGPIAGLVGGGLLIYGGRFARADMELAAGEIVAEQAERQRVASGGAVALLQVRRLDYSYGPVQVLFDVELDVREGEVLALLGTNGAGKSTLLRAISGLGYPDRGEVRLAGATITFADSEERVKRGIVQVAGGKGVFPTLTVAENLTAGAYTYIWDRGRVQRRAEEVLELFPVLQERTAQLAGSLSGGERQMLAICKGLMLEPRLLLLDELTMGLAPVVVQKILPTIEQLKAQGMTIVIVEQSVNIALTLADRAVFMEKGRVRFEGPAAELLERDDLVRAVFLGGEGG